MHGARGGDAGVDSRRSRQRRALLVVAVVVFAASLPYVAAAGVDHTPVEPTPVPIDEPLNNSTDTVNDTTDTVNDTTNSTDDTVNDTTDTGNDTTDDTTDTLDDTTDEVTESTNDTVDETENDTDETGETAEDTETQNATVDSVSVRDDGPGNATTVTVTVEADEPNVTVPVNLLRPETRNDAVAVDRLDVTLERSANFTLEVTNSPEPIPNRTPAFDAPAEGTVGLGFLSLNHSVPDSAIGNVTFTFRVAKSRLNASERGDVALYRYHDGSWNELPTEPARETATHYVFRAVSPGLSEFVAGKKSAVFEIRNATVSVTRLRVGDDVQVHVRITNEGGADGTFDAALRLDGDVVATRSLTIAANGTRQTTFERAISEAGTYDVRVNEFPVGSIEVEPESDDTTDDAADSTISAGQPGFGGLQAVLAAVVAGFAAARRTVQRGRA